MSREPEILKSIIDDTEYNKTPQSRNEEILLSILNDTEYTKTPQSREEELLLELKDKIGHGITVEPLSVTENGTYTAPAGTAYSPVEVNITPPQLVKRVTGNPVEFSDGADAPVVKCVTQITGSQDLHGYDKPWPPGAGKNKLDTSSFSTYSYGGVTYTRQSDGGILINGLCTISASIKIVQNMSLILQAGTYTLNRLSVGTSYAYLMPGYKAGTFTLTEDTTITSFEIRQEAGTNFDNVVYYPQLEEGNQPTTYAPYSNICPITAYTEGEIVERGHNVSNEVYEPGYIDIYTGANAASNTTKRTVNYIKIQPNTQYCYVSSSANDVRIAFYGKDKSYVGYFENNYSNPQIFTTPSNAYYLRYYIGNDSYAGVNYPKTVNTYEPYTATTHTTTYPSAIYRGSEDVVNGEVTSEWGLLTFDGSSDENWQRYTTGSAGAYAMVCLGAIIGSRVADNICNYLEVISVGATWGNYDNFLSWRGDDNALCSGMRSITTVEAWRTYLSNNPLQVAYKLATPTTSSVTPTNLPLKTLFGYNHIESSTGEMVLDYITDKYQNFVDTVNRAVPNTRKSGSAAMEVFMSLEKYEESEPDPEDVKGETR